MMRLLRLGDRVPSPSEEKYLMSWDSMGFDDEAIELAYDKTVVKCKELKWAYMNKILMSWHEKGLHSVEQIQSGDRHEGRKNPPGRQEAGRSARDGCAGTCGCTRRRSPGSSVPDAPKCSPPSQSGGALVSGLTKKSAPSLDGTRTNSAAPCTPFPSRARKP